MSKVVGIDLGTTNSLVATVDSGIPLVIADADGRRLTPSVVHYPAPGAPSIVGAPANRQYRRMTRARMEEDAELGSQAGFDMPRDAYIHLVCEGTRLHLLSKLVPKASQRIHQGADSKTASEVKPR